MEIDLLEYIASKLSCEFISDLRVCQDWMEMSALSRCVSQIDASACSLREWADAAQYITGADIRFYDREAAKDYILRYSKAKAQCTSHIRGGA